MKKKFFIPPCATATDDVSLPVGRNYAWLAPLAGYSDLPFRLLCRELGASVCVTEMVSAKGLLYRSPGTGELLLNSGGDAPLAVQLFGAGGEEMAGALEILARAGYRLFDVNLGCSVPKVMRQGAGAALLSDMKKCLDMAAAMFRAVSNAESPCRIGFKMRLGLSPGKKVAPDLALRLEDMGAAWICLHPRYANQGFGGRADWNELALLARRLTIPLIASGDMLKAEDGIRCLGESGASAVMYARGALRDPAIFRDHGFLAAGLAPPGSGLRELGKIIRRHVALIARHFSEEKALFSLKFIVPRYVRDSPHARAIRQRLCACGGWDDFEAVMQEYFSEDS